MGLSFQLVPDNVNTSTAIWFLTNLHYHFGRPLVVVWDRWSVHRSAARHIRTRHRRWFDFEWLPAYAPELNPVECTWNHTKYATLANFIPDDLQDLSHEVQHSMKRQAQDQQLLRSHFDYAELQL